MRDRFLAGVLCAALGMGCAGYVAPVIPAIAPLYTNTKAPLDVEYDETRLGSKVGRAATTAVLGFAWGDASIAAAVQDGGITTIRHADYEYVNVLFGIYQSFTVVVRGD